MSNLSAAQLQERRDAARARWTKAREAGAALAGGASGVVVGSVVGAAIGETIRARRVAAARDALAPLRSAIQRNQRNQTFIDQRSKKAKSGLRSESNFLSTASRAYDIKFRAAARIAAALAAHQAAHSETYVDSTSGETVQATDDIAGESDLRGRAGALNADQAERFRATANDLRTNGKNSRKVPRAGSIRLPKTQSFTRAHQGKLELAMSARIKQHLGEIFAADDAARAAGGTDLSVFHELGIKSIADLERRFREVDPAYRKAFAQSISREAQIPRFSLRRSKQTVEVTNTARVVPAHTVKLPGYPSDKERQAIRVELMRDIVDRHRAKTQAETLRAAGDIGDARARVSHVARSLRWLRPGSLARRGLVGAGASVGLLAGAFAAARAERAFENTATAKRKINFEYRQTQPLQKMQRLAKASPDDDNTASQNPVVRRRRTTAQKLLDVAKGVESDLAEGVGRALVSWKDAVTPESVADPDGPAGLFDHLDAPLNDGMAPMDRATAAGLTAPARIQPPPNEVDTSDPKPRLINFGFDLRSPETEAYAKRYRYSRVRDITDGQRKNVRQIILDATKTGDPPAVIARSIRDVVGLTAYQAKIVQKYRAVLETNDPRALSYTLRDRRFDPSVKKALENKKAMPADHIDVLVDAYQRRFIAHRAMTIARTESLRAANNGHATAITKWLTDNPEYTVAKTWIATDDDRTRPDHAGLHRKTVIGLQTPFVCDSGEKIRWPHDPLGAANEVINCRCSWMTVLIPRAAAARHGPNAYGNPYPGFWSGPKPAYNIDSPDDLFRQPEFA